MSGPSRRSTPKIMPGHPRACSSWLIWPWITVQLEHIVLAPTPYINDFSPFRWNKVRLSMKFFQTYVHRGRTLITWAHFWPFLTPSSLTWASVSFDILFSNTYVSILLPPPPLSHAHVINVCPLIGKFVDLKNRVSAGSMQLAAV